MSTLATRADAAGARLTWLPSFDARVVGYHVWVRPAGAVYGSPIDVGQPTPASNGTLSYSVSNLIAGQSYRFAVTGYTTVPSESGISNEVALGPTNPCRVDKCVSTTVCDIRNAADGSSCDDGRFCDGIAVCESGTCVNGPPPDCSDGIACTTDSCDDSLGRCVHVSQQGCCVTGADCVDTDACTTNERCSAGTCVSDPVICPTTSCANAICDPQDGCGLMPTPDGVTCTEVCDFLQTRRMVVKGDQNGSGLNLRSLFTTAASVNPTATGLTLEMVGDAGEVVYQATVPGAFFIAKRDGKKFRYLASSYQMQLTNGVFGIVLKQRNGAWTLNVRANSLDLFDAMGQSHIGLVVNFGTSCVRNSVLTCESDQARSVCE